MRYSDTEGEDRDRHQRHGGEMRETMRALMKHDDPMRRMLGGDGPSRASQIGELFHRYTLELAPEYGVKMPAIEWDALPENERELWEAVGEKMLRSHVMMVRGG